MSQPLTDAAIALASGTAIPIVTGLVNVAKPFLELLPWADPHNAADKPTHDATLQVFNLLATVGVTLLMAVFFGYINDPSQLWIAGVQIVCITALADANYRGSHSSGSSGTATAGSVALPAPTVASVASALGAGIAAMEAPAPATPAVTPAVVAPEAASAAPLHQQWLPTAVTPSAPTPAAGDAAADDGEGDENGPATQPALVAVSAQAAAAAAEPAEPAI
jgi:hypothetical protein